MCATHGHQPGGYLLTKRTDAERGVIQQTLADFREVLRNVHDSLLSALREQGVDMTRPGRARLAVERVLDPYREAFDVVLERIWQDGAEAGRGDAIQRHDLSIDFSITRPEVTEALQENAREASELIQETMVEDLGDALVDANDRGLGIPEITDELQDEVFPDARDHEAERIARTETISASNKGAEEAYRDSSATMKEWLATDDGRTRRTHRDADGQTVPIDENFTVGGEQAPYPGAMSLSPKERINCRCSLVPVFD